MQLELGQLIKGRYKLTESIREGGFAMVFRALDIEENRDVAIKFMKPNAFVSEDSFARFQNEAMQMMQLPHKNILAVYSVDLSGTDMPLLVTEYLPWRSLREVLIEKKNLSYQDCKNIFSQICAGLAFAHSNGIIHRDLSPSHIVISEEANDPLVKIIDFGASRQLRESTGRSITITQLSKTGKLIGNPAFMSPETTMGEKADKVSDIYSLGCVLYMMLCGRPPFESKAPLDLILKHQREFPQEPQFDWKDQNNEASHYKYVALRCLQKDRHKRFQSVDEIITCLSTEKDNWNQISGLSGWKKSDANKVSQTGEQIAEPVTNKIKTPLLIVLSLLLLLTIIGLSYESMRNDHNDKDTSLIEHKANSGQSSKDESRQSNLEQAWLLELKRQEQVFGVGHPRTFNLVFRMAQLYEDEGKFKEAEACYKKSLAIKEEEFGKNTAETMPVLLALANLYKSQKKYTDAAAHYQIAAGFPDTRLPASQALADCYRESGETEKALEQYNRAIKLSENSKQTKAKIILARSYLGASECLQKHGKSAESEMQFKRALTVLESVPSSSPEATELIAAMEEYAKHFRSSGNLNYAEQLESKIKAHKTKSETRN